MQDLGSGNDVTPSGAEAEIHTRLERSEQDRAEALRALRTSEARLSLALESRRMGLWEWDIVSGRVEWSPNLEAIHGLQPGTFGGRFEDFRRDIHPEDETRVLDTMRRAAETGATYEIQYRIVDPAGQIIWLEARGRVLLGADDRPERVIGLCSDITERNFTEMAAEENARRKDGFLALLGHELRNPLAPIMNCMHVIRLPNATSVDVEHAWQMMERQVGHLSRLVDDLLEVSRTSSGRIMLSKERIDLAELVRQEIDRRRLLLGAKGLTVESDLPADPVMIDADSARLSQVLGNLLHNAVKFTDRGGAVTITLRTQSNAALLSLRDTGSGIASDVLGRVFEPFVQAESGIDRSRGGLGLGLAVAKAIMELHGGAIEARSDGIGKGSEFIVKIPLAGAIESREPSELPLRAQPLRVLLIEDNPDAVESMRLMLELEHHHVAIANEGATGFELAHTFAPDLVLCDIGLPGSWDGYAVARAFRADPALSAIPLVAFTGYGQSGDRERSLAAGFDAHLTKPVRYEALRRLFGALGLISVTPFGQMSP